MPYIPTEKRAHALVHPDSSGELNFALTTLVHHYLHGHGLSYTTLNDIVGALECCKAEFQRRVVAPYEGRKIVENGDVS